MSAATGEAAKNEVLALIGQVDRLPTPPIVFSQINRVLANPSASAYDVAKIIAEDPGTSARVLRMANSAYYALPQPVVSVRQAVVILGMEAIRSVVVSTAVMDAFGGAELDQDFQNNFWRHSLATASAARVLHGFKMSDRVLRGGEEGFSAGLLHDIGKMLLAWRLPDRYQNVMGHEHYGQTDDYLVEREVIGVSHAEIGAFLGTRWNLPESLLDAIAHHHDLPADATAEGRLSRVVHVADYLAHYTIGSGSGRSKNLPDLNWGAAAEFGVTEENIAEVSGLVRAEFGRSETFLEMMRK